MCLYIENIITLNKGEQMHKLSKESASALAGLQSRLEASEELIRDIHVMILSRNYTDEDVIKMIKVYQGAHNEKK
jgi:hypothetical protein|tara:strand:- start:7 stop:231 length:225 start_codon:yes stop_codon:yes gene_type:complete